MVLIATINCFLPLDLHEIHSKEEIKRAKKCIMGQSNTFTATTQCTKVKGNHLIVISTIYVKQKGYNNSRMKDL